MKIGSGRFKWSKLPDAPPTPSSPNTSSSSKSSTNLAYTDSINRELSGINLNDSSRIAGSQSKSSGALLQKQKWGDEKGAPNDIYQLLAEQKLTDEYIWGGHPDLFPIIHQYSEMLSAKASSSNTAGNVLSINLPEASEFGDIKKKSYKIGKKLTVAQTVNLICKKQNINNPRRFWLSTLMGCILNDEMLLSSYGFGTFFDSWELNLIPKDIYTSRLLTDFPIENFGEFVVDFQLPPLKQFGGLKKKRIKVDSNIPILQILSQICNKYKIEEPERFSIISTDEFPLVLNNQATLSHYGLGTIISTMELNIVFTEFIPPYSLKNNSIPTYGAFQVGNVNPVQSKAVIIDLENKLQDSLALGEDMVQNIKNLVQELKEKEKELKDKEQQHFTVMNHIEEKLTTIKKNVTIERESHSKQIADLKQEKENLQDQINQLKQQIEDLNATLFQERSNNTEQTLKFNYEITTLNCKVEQLEQDNQELKSNIQDQEVLYENLRTQKEEEYQRFCEQALQKEKEKLDLCSKYENHIKQLQREHEEKIKQIFKELQDKEKEQEEISNRIYNDVSERFSTPIEPIGSTGISDDSGFSSIEREQLLSSVQRLQQEIIDRDVIIKQVYPKKIQTIETNFKKLDEKLKETERENQQSKQTIALKSLEIVELNRQIETLKNNNEEIQNKLNHSNNLYNEEEKKNRRLLNDLSTLKGQFENEVLENQQKAQLIKQMDESRIEQEFRFKEREAFLLNEIEELKRPKPPPLPTFKVEKPKSPDSSSDKTIQDVKNSLKPIPNIPPPPREHTIATVADLLFVSMQKRFQSIQGIDDVEDLDEDLDDGEFDD
ncbi:hypothetical protein DICPUDRAFT_157483 [Dictyostelium purpureum]|uniref:Uncharacterized protein n=1 Tax=Dictyostelium purpureum TaxID=5786 RepID=F0ZZ88_DICPU|nr:uncharacterized protein DICPUDRAFT_157483 [Dictyostelium purpureum]EGC30750.1 hypothetical protein DICPUDRAFT_157483 [Dictyostelium purpureum]|eukprot:XP_003292734.1 hypothetical protein DICPUDRAFT_157483 [Dictyostelium purpureum]